MAFHPADDVAAHHRAGVAGDFLAACDWTLANRDLYRISTVLTAGEAGVVASILVLEGDTATPNAPLVWITDTHEVHVKFKAGSNQALSLALAAPLLDRTPQVAGAYIYPASGPPVQLLRDGAGWRALAVALFLAACFTKASAIVLPALLLAAAPAHVLAQDDDGSEQDPEPEVSSQDQWRLFINTKLRQSVLYSRDNGPGEPFHIILNTVHGLTQANHQSHIGVVFNKGGY